MKEFLRPTKVKIILFIVLLLISLYILFFRITPLYTPDVENYNYNNPWYVFIFLLPMIALVGATNIIQFYIFLVLEILYLYLISCLIIYIYNKMKTKSLNTK